jgi:hypothetical protein
MGLPQYMRGAVFWEPNKPLTIEDFHMPHPKAGELLIKTKGGSEGVWVVVDLIWFFCVCLFLEKMTKIC